jgi:transcription initiation factor TFIID TATA-box-binding protein
MDDATATIEIQNVVASTAIGQELELEQLAMDLEGTDYNPEQFPGLVFRQTDPQSAVLIFRSGKLVCTGAQTVNAVEASFQTVFDDFQNLGIPIDGDPEITVQNIVMSGDLGTTLNLNAIAIGLGLETVEYEPEQFPGLVYRMDEPDVVTLLFGSGKVVITGATAREDGADAMTHITDELDQLGLLA